MFKLHSTCLYQRLLILVPESFKVLIKELQSIALDIRVLNSDSNEIIIRDDDDDSPVRKNDDTIDSPDIIADLNPDDNLQ